MNTYLLDPVSPITLDTLELVRHKKIKIALSDNAKKAINQSKNFLEEKLIDGGVHYGINTGFGKMCDVHISDADREELQINLLRSHAIGVGKTVPLEIVRLMLVLKAQSLCIGYSGVALSTVERLLDFYNEDLLPVVYDTGSLGASGDLAPLSHLCLPLLGEGEVYYKGERRHTMDVMLGLNYKPITLSSKEGLALINGTQFMLAYSTLIVLEAHKLLKAANQIAAFSADVWLCKHEAFYDHIHRVRKHKGQSECAATILSMLQESPLHALPKKQVQDPYSFRCIPQVHGASADTINYITKVVMDEAASVTDNPLLFPDDDLILSGGNFHGQPLALVLDFMAIALAELGSISERRTYLLLSGERGLPAFLVQNPGLNSGMMIAQYTAAALVSKNKQLCTPASVDSITSSNGQEDHVSMGANAATKCYDLMNNLYDILSIELSCALQAYYLRTPIKTSPILEDWIAPLLDKIQPLKKDRYMKDELMTIKAFLSTH